MPARLARNEAEKDEEEAAATAAARTTVEAGKRVESAQIVEYVESRRVEAGEASGRAEEAGGGAGGGAAGGAGASPELLAIWSRVVRAGGEGRPLLRAVLTNLTLVEIEAGAATLVPVAGWASRAAKHLSQIAELLEREVGVPLQPRLVGGDLGSGGSLEAGGGTGTGGQGPTPVLSSAGVGSVQATEHPLVKVAVEVFGGRIVDVQPRRAGS